MFGTCLRPPCLRSVSTQNHGLLLVKFPCPSGSKQTCCLPWPPPPWVECFQHPSTLKTSSRRGKLPHTKSYQIAFMPRSLLFHGCSCVCHCSHDGVVDSIRPSFALSHCSSTQDICVSIIHPRIVCLSEGFVLARPMYLAGILSSREMIQMVGWWKCRNLMRFLRIQLLDSSLRVTRTHLASGHSFFTLTHKHADKHQEREIELVGPHSSLSQNFY